MRIASKRSWRNPRSYLGDFDGGRFRVLEDLPAAPSETGGAYLELRLDADRATLIGILCESEEAARWRDVLGTLCAEPERVRGR